MAGTVLEFALLAHSFGPCSVFLELSNQFQMLRISSQLLLMTCRLLATLLSHSEVAVGAFTVSWQIFFVFR